MFEVITQIDHEILLFIQENLRFDWFTEPTIFVTHLGDYGTFWILLCIGLLLFKRTRKAGICGLLAMLIGALITNVTLKPLVARIRPYEQFSDLLLLIEAQSDFSFPSGHTCSSLAAAWAIFKNHRDSDNKWTVLGMAAMILAIWISWSRLYVAVHFPTDVLVGAIAGIFSAWAAGKLIDRIIEYRMQKAVTDNEKEDETHE